MAREHKEEKEKQTQIIEREVNLSLINDKLNHLIGLNAQIAEKIGLDVEED